MQLFLDKYPVAPLNQKRPEGKRVFLRDQSGQRNPHGHWDAGAMEKKTDGLGHSHERHERERSHGEHHHLPYSLRGKKALVLAMVPHQVLPAK
jgi:hypothetical protein